MSDVQKETSPGQGPAKVEVLDCTVSVVVVGGRIVDANFTSGPGDFGQRMLIAALLNANAVRDFDYLKTQSEIEAASRSEAVKPIMSPGEFVSRGGRLPGAG